MTKISTYPLDGDPKLSDKLIGTSSGYSEDGELLNPTYNFSLQQLLDLFLPVIPSNTLQGVLDYGNTATQDINLFGKITTTNLEVTNISTLFSAYVSDSLYIEGGLFDRLNSSGTSGQILKSTGGGVEWITPVVNIPTLQEVLDSGNEADVNIILTADLSAEVIEANTVLVQDSFQLNGSFIDSNGLTGTSGQMLVSLGASGVLWQDVPVYTASSPLFINPATKNITIQQANSTQNGYLSYIDWINFDGKQNALSGTGIVVSNGGTITYITNNSANWNQAYNDSIVSAAVTGTTTKTLTLTQRDGDVITTTWNDEEGGIGSIGLDMPAAFIVTNSPLTSDGVIEVQAAGNALQYIKGDGTLGTFPVVSEFVPYTGATQDVVLGSNKISAQEIIKNGGTSSQFLKADGSIDSNSYITLASLLATSPLIYDNLTGTFSIQQANTSQGGYLSAADWNAFNGKQAAGNYITDLTGEASASGPGVASVVLNNAAVIAKVLTGLNVTGGSIVSTDTILQAFGKLQNQINGLIGGSTYQGTWNASTNTPTLTSGVGTDGYYYIVNVAGNTNLNGITDWKVGDWAIFHGGTWQKVDNTDSVVSVNGYTGAVNLVTSDIPEGLTNLYFTDARARLALSFAAGSGAYDNVTGVITIPTDNSQILNGAGYITSAALTPYLLSSVAASTYYPIPTGTTSQYVRGDGSLAPFPALTGYIPYVGATQNVDLGVYQLKADSLAISTTSAQSVDVGEIVWNAVDGTFDMGLIGGVTLQAGQEMHIYGKASGAISNGDAVMFAGVQGDHLLIAKADPVVIDANPEYFIGIATQDFTNNQFGYVTVFGNVRTLDTSSYILGSVLYFNSATPVAGQLTSSMPPAPHAKIIVAAVVKVSTTQGILMVRPQIMPKIEELQDVAISGVSDGDVLIWATNKWINATVESALGYVPANQNTTIDTLAPLQGGGNLSANRTLSITQASGSTNGYLSSTDWNIFNNKQNALTNPIIGTGTTNYLPKFTGLTSLGNSQIFDNGTNVGINNNNPLAKLDVNGQMILGVTGIVGAKINARDNLGGLQLFSTATDFNGAYFLMDSASKGGSFLMTHGNFNATAPSSIFAVRYANNGTITNQFQINSNGNIGINNPSASEKLDVIGNIKATSFIKTGGTSSQFLKADGSVDSTSYQPLLTNPITGTGTTNFLSKFTASGTIGNSQIFDNGANVGIGTTNPISLLHINNANTNPNALTVGNNNNGAIFGCTNNGNPIIGAYTGDLPIQFGYFSGGISTSFTERMRITSGGNVGIGTSSPSARFQIGDLYRVTNDAVTTWGVTNGMGILSWDSNLAIIGGLANTDVQFRANNQEVMRLTTGGKVGIGTSSPSVQLNVMGQVIFDDGTLGAISPEPNSILQLESDRKGFLPPRLTETQRNSISAPVAGLMIFNKDSNYLEVYDGINWRALAYV